MSTTTHDQAERIDRHRQVAIHLEVRDGTGRPRRDTPVDLRQTRHRFLFGANIFPLDPDNRSAVQLAYRRHFTDLLNFATLPFYWNRYEPERDRPARARLEAMARWCRAQGLTVKGHPLCWHASPPTWLPTVPPQDLWPLQLERITREVTAFRGLVDMWDVVNEAVVLPRFTYRPNHLTPLAQTGGVLPIIEAAFARARAANAEAVLLLNDYDQSEEYAQLIERCLDAGVTIDVIGIQSHMHQGYLGDQTVWEICERFARFGKPLHWTEASLISGTVKPDNDFQTRQADWPTTPDGEARQAEEVAAFYRTLYSHPAVAAITWWDFQDGSWLNAPSGLVRADMTPKPAYHALHRLIRGAWWFAPQTLHTDADGVATFRGPPGDYEATIDGTPVAFSPDGDGTQVLSFTS